MAEFNEKSNKVFQSKSESGLLIAELYPELNQAEQDEAEYFLNRFLEVMHDIFEENQGKISN